MGRKSIYHTERNGAEKVCRRCHMPLPNAPHFIKVERGDPPHHARRLRAAARCDCSVACYAVDTGRLLLRPLDDAKEQAREKAC